MKPKQMPANRALERPTYLRALEMLAESAESGNVSARIALERALRTQAEGVDEVDAAIRAILDSPDTTDRPPAPS